MGSEAVDRVPVTGSLSGTPAETGQTVGLAKWVGTEHDRLAAIVRRGIGGGGAPGASR